MERRLSAILAADVVGYSRLMEQNEADAFERLRAHRKELLEPEAAKHHGRIFKLMGDGLLIEFGSVVDAVECAVAVQRGMAERNGELANAQRIVLRIGINLGDVIVEGDDRHGEGVNIAARLQQLAEPGGIAVSRTVVDHVKHRLALRFESLGEHHVKNIAESIAVYRVRSDNKLGQSRAWAWLSTRRGRSTSAAMLALLLAIGGGGAAWYFHLRAQPATHRLSIVVLPLVNLGHDPEQEYFADGITNDLTTDLSRIDGSFIISPTTALTYKGKAIDAKQVGRELGVRYLLEGSLRRTGNLVRLNAQLIDTVTGAEVWADRFEGDWTKSMELQDEITARLARTLDLELTAAEGRRAQSEAPNSADAVDLTLRAKSILYQPPTRQGLAQARELLEQALRVDPQLPEAQVALAYTLTTEVIVGWSTAPAENLARADEAVRPVLSAFPNRAMAHLVKGDILRARFEFVAAIREYEVAISSNPSLAVAYANLGNAQTRAGRAKEAFAPLEKAIRLSPRDPLLNYWYFQICHAHTHLAHDDEAIEWCRRSVAMNPFWIAYVDLASAYAWTGRDAEAHAAIAELTKLMPNYTVDRWAHARWSDNPVFLAQYQRIIEGLRKAGLPET